MSYPNIIQDINDLDTLENNLTSSINKVENSLQLYLPLAGGTMTGDKISFSNNSHIRIENSADADGNPLYQQSLGFEKRVVLFYSVEKIAQHLIKQVWRPLVLPIRTVLVGI